MTPPATQTSVHPASVWEDLVDIFYTPREVFARRRTSGYAIPLIVLVVVVGLLFVAGRPLFQALMDSEFARNTARAGMSPEQLERARNWSERLSIVMVPVGTALTVFVVGAVLLGVARAFDVRLSFTAGCMIATYASYPRILQHVAGVIQGYLFSTDSLTSFSQITLSLGRFADPDTTPRAFMQFLERFDVFTIWVTVLLGIGVAVVGETTTRRATLIAMTMWLLGTLIVVLGGLRG